MDNRKNTPRAIAGLGFGAEKIGMEDKNTINANNSPNSINRIETTHEKASKDTVWVWLRWVIGILTAVIIAVIGWFIYG